MDLMAASLELDQIRRLLREAMGVRDWNLVKEVERQLWVLETKIHFGEKIEEMLNED